MALEAAEAFSAGVRRPFTILEAFGVNPGIGVAITGDIRSGGGMRGGRDRQRIGMPEVRLPTPAGLVDAALAGQADSSRENLSELRLPAGDNGKGGGNLMQNAFLVCELVSTGDTMASVRLEHVAIALTREAAKRIVAAKLAESPKAKYVILECWQVSE